MPLNLLDKRNRIIGPSSLYFDRSPVGYVTNDGVNYSPTFEKLPFEADQVENGVGGSVIQDAGTVGFTAIEILEENFAELLDLPAGADFTSGSLAGADFDMRPNRDLTMRQIEWYGKWGRGGVGHFVVGGELANLPKIARSAKEATVFELTYDLVKLCTQWPCGFCRLYDAVTGALTVTSTPADEATGVATSAAIALAFNKPVSVLALAGDNFSLVADSAPTVAIPFTASIGTTTKGGLTILDPSKITITPDAALTAGAHTFKVMAGIPAVDGTTIAADVAVGFTVGA